MGHVCRTGILANQGIAMINVISIQQIILMLSLNRDDGYPVQSRVRNAYRIAKDTEFVSIDLP